MRKACAQSVYRTCIDHVLTHKADFERQRVGINSPLLHTHVHTELVHRAPFTHRLFSLFTDCSSGLYTFFTDLMITTTMYLNNNIIRRAA